MHFRKPLDTKRGTIKTTREALHFIDRELPAELKALSRWTFAEALLLEAERSQKKRDMDCAYRQLRQALKNDRLIKRDRSRPAPEAVSGQPAEPA
jgi:hypothetical protein